MSTMLEQPSTAIHQWNEQRNTALKTSAYVRYATPAANFQLLQPAI
jgi:hypothetical protein